MATALDDVNDVAAARAGDRAAFARLVTRHRPPLLAVCRRAARDPMLAEDAAQEAVLRAMLSLDRLRRPERFGSWLAGIGLNICRRWRRRDRHAAWSWEALLGGTARGEPVDPAPAVLDQVEVTELRGLVQAAVSALPPGQRAAVALYYLAGLTQAETAVILGIPPGAVKTRLHKGRANLRDYLRPLRELSDVRTTGVLPMITVTVADVRAPSKPAVDGNLSYAVLLREDDSDRLLPIWIGEHEATALALQLTGIEMPRPMTYAMMAAVLTAAGGSLAEVRIERLEGETYYATVVIAGPVGQREIDARPSDALNLALLLDAPIRVAAAMTDWFIASEQELASPLRANAAGAAAIAATVTERWAAQAAKHATAISGEDR